MTSFKPVALWVCSVALAAALAQFCVSTGIAQSARVQELFRLFDENGDGRISREEFESHKVVVIFRNAKDRQAKLRFEDTHLTRAAFDAIDIDRTGVITARDVMFSPLFNFETFDADRDGSIDLQEFSKVISEIER